MSVHRINLRGPWKLEHGTVAASSAQKVRLPAEWHDLFRGSSGLVRLTRTFHRPTNLGPEEEVDLIFEQWPGGWTISLNQRPIAEFRDSSVEKPQRITVTALLQPANALSAETQLDDRPGQRTGHCLVGAASLEIRSP
jgi:hypothetical protein